MTDSSYVATANVRPYTAPPSGRGRTAWITTLATLVAMTVLVGGLTYMGEIEAAVWVAIAVVVWSLFGLTTMAALAMQERGSFGFGLMSGLMAVFVVPAATAGVMFGAGAAKTADELNSIFDGSSTGSSSDPTSQYDTFMECMIAPGTTFEECEPLQ